MILLEIFLSGIFVSITAPERDSTYPYREAAILEWIIAFMGAIYLWLFGGFFLDRLYSPHHSDKDDLS